MPSDEGEPLLSDEDFAREAELAGQGHWEELDLDAPPADWQPTTIEDLRHAG